MRRMANWGKRTFTLPAMVATNYANLLGVKPLSPRNASRGRLANDPDMNRDAIRLIDHQLDALEMIHMGSGDMSLLDSVRDALARLQCLSSVPFSLAIRRATTSYELHEALLDFQARLLD